MAHFISIDYTEVGGDNYKGVVVSSKSEEIVRFFSGDVEKDWKAMIDYCVKNPEMYVFNSSVDHFVMDVEGYKWALDEYSNEIIVKDNQPSPAP